MRKKYRKPSYRITVRSTRPWGPPDPRQVRLQSAQTTLYLPTYRRKGGVS